jgi:large subunit ribosomal protein L9
MQVLLLKDVEGLGRAGDVKDVAGGYARNFLIPRKLAVPATEGALRQARTIKQAVQQRQDRRLSEAQALAARIEGQELTFHMRAGEGERLYGSVTSTDIAEALSRMVGAEIDRRWIELEHSLKTLGRHNVTVRLGPGISAQVAVQIERAGEE